MSLMPMQPVLRPGHRYGLHRVVQPRGVLPQQAEILDASSPLYDNEVLIEVESLNIDSASFHQIRSACKDDVAAMERMILDIIRSRGKMQNPVTGSGGMLIGKVKAMGPRFLEGQPSGSSLHVGDPIATLVSLTLTPLCVERILKIHLDSDRVDLVGEAVLFQSGPWSRLPSDLPQSLSLALLDVCGAPAHTARMCKPGQTVVVLGGGGKSGILCLYEAKKAVGAEGRVIGLDYHEETVQRLKGFSFVDDAAVCDARNAVSTMETVQSLTGGRFADIVINVTNIPDTEMATILSVRPQGIAYLFSMATSFTKAALGSEGVGADCQLVIGNGFCPGHADLTLNIVRESTEIRKLYEARYGAS